MSAGKQRCHRIRMVLPLRIWLDREDGETPVWRWAHTVDISPIGCRLGGLRDLLAPGQTVTLQRGQHKATFRVIWSNQLAPNENQAGTEAVDFDHTIWGIELPPESSLPASSESGTENNQAEAHDDVHPDTPSNKPQTLSPVARAFKRWGLRLGLSFLGLFSALMVYQELSYRYGEPEIQAQVPAAPGARDLAAPRPRPHAEATLLTKSVDLAVSRLQIAEAPIGRVVYPEAPEDGGKGQVRLKLIIAANGIVKQIQSLSGKPALAEAAARAVHLWHYSSLTGRQEVAERETTVTVNFVGADAVSLEFPLSNSQIQMN